MYQSIGIDLVIFELLLNIFMGLSVLCKVFRSRCSDKSNLILSWNI